MVVVWLVELDREEMPWMVWCSPRSFILITAAYDGAGEKVYAQKEGDVHRVSVLDERAIAKRGCAPLSD